MVPWLAWSWRMTPGLITNLTKHFQKNWWKKRTRLIFLRKHNWGGESLFCIGLQKIISLRVNIRFIQCRMGLKKWWQKGNFSSEHAVTFDGVNWGKISEVYSKRVYVKMLDQNITLPTFPNPHSTPQILRSTELWDSQAFHSKVYLPRATVIHFAGFGGHFFGPPTHQSQPADPPLISRDNTGAAWLR